MRGSVFYQTSQLVKVVFRQGAKKEDRINQEHEHYNCIASYNTMETYRRIWNNFFTYLREQFKLKNCELINKEHIKCYFEYKIEYSSSELYAQKISSALGKLEFALNKYSKEKYTDNKREAIIYEFKIRQNILNDARKYDLIADNYHNRTYIDAELIIDNMIDEKHQIAAAIQNHGGARLEGVNLIKREQLKGTKIDELTKNKVGILNTREKGGKQGDVYISIDIYYKLKDFFEQNNVFKIIYQDYLNDIKQACIKSNEVYEGTHGFRYSFAQRRVRQYQHLLKCSYYEAIQKTSWEMKHFRANIVEHYLS